MFYIRRTNAIGNVFFLGLKAEWRAQWNSGIGGYKVHTYKTLNGANVAADTFAKQYRGQSVSVMTDDGGTRVLNTFSYAQEPRHADPR